MAGFPSCQWVLFHNILCITAEGGCKKCSSDWAATPLQFFNGASVWLWASPPTGAGLPVTPMCLACPFPPQRSHLHPRPQHLWTCPCFCLTCLLPSCLVALKPQEASLSLHRHLHRGSALQMPSLQPPRAAADLSVFPGDGAEGPWLLSLLTVPGT